MSPTLGSPYIQILRGRDGRDGPQGSTGAAGRDGRDGERGDRGETGIQGPIGETGEQGPPGATSGGVTYTRWGKTSCPTVSGTGLVYAGITAGSEHRGYSGGGSNYLCMPHNPQYGRYRPGVQGHSPIYGTEYQTYTGSPIASSHDYNVPCAVCFVSTRVTALMLPARLECPNSWNKMMITIAQCSNVWTPTQIPFQEVLQTLMVLSSGTLRPAAMVYHVDLMTQRKNSPVLYALSKQRDPRSHNMYTAEVIV